MQAALKREWVSVADYLAGEEGGETKHDYLGGWIYAMAGATTAHNLIAMNLAFAARSHLKGRPCRVFLSDVKVRLQIAGEHIFYYPDVMVGCDPRDTHSQYLRYPKVLVEVSSESTERLDRGEKRLHYQTVETLEDYAIVAQDRPEVTLFRRGNNWTPERFAQLDQDVVLTSIGLSLSLSAIYEGVLQGRA
jgi:Uma2 family endonuclease